MGEQTILDVAASFDNMLYGFEYNGDDVWIPKDIMLFVVAFAKEVPETVEILSPESQALINEWIKTWADYKLSGR